MGWNWGWRGVVVEESGVVVAAAAGGSGRSCRRRSTGRRRGWRGVEGTGGHRHSCRTAGGWREGYGNWSLFTNWGMSRMTIGGKGDLNRSWWTVKFTYCRKDKSLKREDWFGWVFFPTFNTFKHFVVRGIQPRIPTTKVQKYYMCLWHCTDTQLILSLSLVGRAITWWKRERGKWRGRVLAVWRHFSKTIFTGRRRFLELTKGEHDYEELGKG